MTGTTEDEDFMADDLEIDLDAIQRRMDGAMNALRTEFASLRTGRASASIVEPIMVDAYGQMTPINQLGTVNVPEPRMVVINVWDKAMIAKVEKAIRESGIGINPITDGPLIRLPIPELNEERRRQLTKVAAGYAENAKVAIRNVRRDGMDQIKKAKAAGMGEDDQKMWSEEVQESTDKAIAAVDRALEQQAARDHAGLSGHDLSAKNLHKRDLGRTIGLPPKLSQEICPGGQDGKARIDETGRTCRHHHGWQWPLGHPARAGRVWSATARAPSGSRRSCAAPPILASAG